MITIQQKLFRLLMIFSPAMQGQTPASPDVASLPVGEQRVAAVLPHTYNHNLLLKAQKKSPNADRKGG